MPAGWLAIPGTPGSDNTTSQCKTNDFNVWLATLAGRLHFRTCDVHFLVEGHAREDIDQLLAVILELVMRGGMMSCHCCMGLRPTNGGVQHHRLPGITDDGTSETSEDIISLHGFENAFAHFVKNPSWGLWMAPVCSSWTFANSSNTGRKLAYVVGNLGYPPAQAGNAMATVSALFMELAWERGLAVVIENPASSLTFEGPCCPEGACKGHCGVCEHPAPVPLTNDLLDRGTTSSTNLQLLARPAFTKQALVSRRLGRLMGPLRLGGGMHVLVSVCVQGPNRGLQERV